MKLILSMQHCWTCQRSAGLMAATWEKNARTVGAHWCWSTQL